MPIKRIVPYLESADFRAVKSFYVDTLGLEVAMEDPGIAGLPRALIARQRKRRIMVGAEGLEPPMPDLGVDVGDPAAVDAPTRPLRG